MVVYGAQPLQWWNSMMWPSGTQSERTHTHIVYTTPRLPLRSSNKVMRPGRQVVLKLL